ncbi:MAG: zinc ABC transporter substrate-binding protein [Deltaproteobacteria bacterium]|nr:zinc ABC transporter substrate-binding protein [Deltaproteobacteria bacterium]
MRIKSLLFGITALAITLVGFVPYARAEKLKVVVTSSAYKSIAEYIGGDKVEVSRIVRGNQDPHIVRPKPSLAVTLSQADVFVATGMDLEMWAPALVDMSNNPNIRSGQKGYVSASAGVKINETPITVSRAEGDVHIYGNPHIHTSPLNGKTIAENICTGLKKNASQHTAYFEKKLKQFKDEIDRRTFGAKLVDMVGGKTLTKLAQRGKLIPFLEKKSYKGKPLIDHLDGWMKKALPLRGQKLVAYHKNWSYFTALFGIEIVGYMEPKPGIPPTPGHVAATIDKMKKSNIKVMLAANYFDVGKVKTVANRVGATPVVIALAPGGEKGMNNFFDQFDIWLDRLTKAFAKVSG